MIFSPVRAENQINQGNLVGRNFVLTRCRTSNDWRRIALAASLSRLPTKTLKWSITTLRVKPCAKFTLSFCANLAAEPVEPSSARGPPYLPWSPSAPQNTKRRPWSTSVQSKSGTKCLTPGHSLVKQLISSDLGHTIFICLQTLGTFRVFLVDLPAYS